MKMRTSFEAHRGKIAGNLNAFNKEAMTGSKKRAIMVTRMETRIIRGMQAMTLCLLISGIRAWSNSRLIITIAMLIGICMYTAVYYIIKKSNGIVQKKSRLLNAVLAKLLIVAVIGVVLALNNHDHVRFNYLTVKFMILQSGAVLVPMSDKRIRYKVCWAILIAEVILTIFL